MGIVGALLGLLVSGGIVLLVVALRSAPRQQPRSAIRVPLASRIWRMRTTVRNAMVGAVAGVVVAAATGMPVLVVICTALAMPIPVLFSKPPSVRLLARQQAVETWVRGLTGMLTGGVGLEAAIRTSLPSTPPPIRPEVRRLVARLQSQEPLETAVRLWAYEMADRNSDLVASVLIMGAQTQHGGLSLALQGLSDSVAQENRVMARIEADRAGILTVTRVVTALSIAAFTTIILGPFGVSYREPLGQAALLVIGLLYAGVLQWIALLRQIPPRPRFLVDPASLGSRTAP